MAKKTETTKSEAVKKNEDLATKRLREYLENNPQIKKCTDLYLQSLKQQAV